MDVCQTGPGQHARRARGPNKPRLDQQVHVARHNNRYSVGEVAFVDPAFESSVEVVNADASGVSLPTGDSVVSETLSSVESMDEDTAVTSAEAVRAVPNVKAVASLKPSSKSGPRPSAKNPSINLSPQQKRNLAKKLRKQARQSAAA